MTECNHFSRDAKYKVLIQSPSETGDNYGGRAVTWADVGTYWAVIQPLSGRELYVQQATQSRATHKITIRYQAALKDISLISDYRISFDGRLFAINAVKNLGRDMKSEGKDYQEFIAEENGHDIQG